MKEMFETTIPNNESSELKRICSACGEKPTQKNRIEFSGLRSKTQRNTIARRSRFLLPLYLFLWLLYTFALFSQSPEIHKCRDFIIFGSLFLSSVITLINTSLNYKSMPGRFSLTYHLCDSCASRNFWLNVLLTSVAIASSLWFVFLLVSTSMFWSQMSLLSRVIWILSYPGFIFLVLVLFRERARQRGFEIKVLKDKPLVLLKFFNPVVGKKCAAH